MVRKNELESEWVIVLGEFELDEGGVEVPALAPADGAEWLLPLLRNADGGGGFLEGAEERE